MALKAQVPTLLTSKKLIKIRIDKVLPEEFWDHSRSAYKAVILENGSKVYAAPHLKTGDFVWVDSETGDYLYADLNCFEPKKGFYWWIRRIKVKIRSGFDFLFICLSFPTLFSILWKAFKIPGEVTVAEAAFLTLAAKEPCFGGGNIVEIGSYKGRSTVCLALGNQALPGRGRVIAIDPHYLNSLEIFRKNMERWDLLKEIEFQPYTSEEAILRTHPGRIRILWIDGHHEYPYVRKDIELWEPFLGEGGLLLLHDCYKPGVVQCINEFIRDSEKFATWGYFCGIAYAVKGKHPADYFFRKIKMIQESRSFLVNIANHLGLRVERSAVLATRLAKDKSQNRQSKN